MNTIIKLPAREREILFRNTAAKCGLNEGIVEKDFWVCWTLDYLFHHSPWSKHLAFKGGTSLSKCFGLIHRFSEDIDLILDWRLLDIAGKDPWADRSKNQQDKFNKALNAETEVFLLEQFIPRMAEDLRQHLTEPFKLEIDLHEPQTVNFTYPKLFSETSILPMVRLEIGALAAWTPTAPATITPYAAQQYPHVFQHPSTEILTVMPERTFWEKVTILHKEAFRTNGNFPSRYSRHYYDLYCMDRSPSKPQLMPIQCFWLVSYSSRLVSILREMPTMSWPNQEPCGSSRRKTALPFCVKTMDICRICSSAQSRVSRPSSTAWQDWSGRSTPYDAPP